MKFVDFGISNFVEPNDKQHNLVAITPWEGEAEWDKIPWLVPESENSSQIGTKGICHRRTCSNEPVANAPRADKDKFEKHMDDMIDVGCLMLATMSLELQKQHEDMLAYEMLQKS